MTSLQPIGGAPTLTEDALDAFQRKHSYLLPADYREFLLLTNGAFPSPACLPFQEGERQTVSDVFCFFAVEEERAGLSMEWHCHHFQGRLPKQTLPIGRDSGGNLWLLSLAHDKPGAIYFWDHGSFANFDETELSHWPRVAASFQDFVDALTEYAPALEEADIPSRYAFVGKAVHDLKEQEPLFKPHAHSDFAWHCECDEHGEIKMQFVQYEVHATATHTCGYNRWRALEGIIEGGALRLPNPA